MSSWRVLAAAAGLAGVTLGSSGAEASWCQYDDPAYVEQQRQALDEPDPGKISCPAIGNPQDRPEQLVLPMPCGRRMVFRRVDFTLEHALDHRQAYLGSVSENRDGAAYGSLSAVVNGQWSDSISGGFSDPKDGLLRRYFYIGKYEVTEAQFQLMGRGLFTETVSESADDAACTDYRDSLAEISGTKVLPAVDMTWLDAVSFAFRYSEWLLALDQRQIGEGQPRSMPWEASAPGFLRLPSEVEWEYAARGGRVDRSDRAERAYYVAENGSVRQAEISEIAALATSQNQPPRGGSVFYVGRRLPNTLGLYDMVGNAEEMVYDLFQPTRPDTLGGQRGGFVVRGGSAKHTASRLGVGYRQESMFFDKSGPVHSPATGFRLLVSVPMIMNLPGEMGNPPLADAISAALGRITDPSHMPETAVLADPRADIENLRQQQAEQLEALRQEHARDQQRLDELNAQIGQLQEAEAKSEKLQELLAAERARISELEAEAQRESAAQREAFERQLTELEEKRAEDRRRIETLQSKLADAANAGQAEEMEALLTATRAELDRLQSERDRELEELEDQHRRELARIQDRQERDRARIAELEQQIRTLQGDSDASGRLQGLLEATRAELETLRTAANDEISELETRQARELDEFRERREADQRRIDELENRLQESGGQSGDEEALRRLLADTQRELRDLQAAADGRLEDFQRQRVEELEALNERRARDAARIRDLESELAAFRGGGGGSLQALLASTREQLAALQAERETNEARLVEMTTALAAARAGLDTSTARLHERDRRIRREQLHSLVLMAANIDNVQRRISAAESLIQSLSADPGQSSKPRVQDAIAKARKVIADLRLFNRANFDYYIDTVYALADAGPEAAGAARRAVASDLATRGLSALGHAHEEAFNHIQEAIGAGGAVPRSRLDAWFDQITAQN